VGDLWEELGEIRLVVKWTPTTEQVADLPSRFRNRDQLDEWDHRIDEKWQEECKKAREYLLSKEQRKMKGEAVASKRDRDTDGNTSSPQ